MATGVSFSPVFRRLSFPRTSRGLRLLLALRPHAQRTRGKYAPRTHPPPDQNDATKALRRLADFLAERGIQVPIPRCRQTRDQGPAAVRPRRDPCAVPGFESLLAEYARFLLQHRGFAESTVASYLPSRREAGKGKAVRLPPGRRPGRSATILVDPPGARCP